MSTRKQSAVLRQQAKARQWPPPAPPAPLAINIEALLMIGEERVHIDCDRDDNVTFMAELID